MPINYNLYLYIPPIRVSRLREEYRDYTIVLPYLWGCDTRRIITPDYYRSRTKHTFEAAILLNNQEKRARLLKAPRIILAEQTFSVQFSYKYFLYDQFFKQTDTLRNYDELMKEISKELNMNIEPATKYSLIIADPYSLQWIPDFKFAPRKTLKPVAQQGNLFIFKLDEVEYEWSIDTKNVHCFIATNRVKLGNHELYGNFITDTKLSTYISEISPMFIHRHVTLPHKVIITLSNNISVTHPEHEDIQFNVQPKSRLFIVHFRLDTVE